MFRWLRRLTRSAIARRFRGARAGARPTLARPSRGEMAAAYRELVEEQMERGGIDPAIVNVEVVPKGRHRDGRPAFTAMVRLLEWRERSALRLLLGLPLLDAKVRRCLAQHWLSHVSFFDGIWLNPSWAVRETDALQEVRDAIRVIEQEQEAAGWTTPAPLRA
jgi:hypothetical protein